MNNLIRKIDLFGTSFQFTIDHNDKYKTITGGILSICFFIFITFFTFYTGKDFYLRHKIISYQDQITPKGGVPNATLTFENMILAWRFRIASNDVQTYSKDGGLFYLSIDGLTNGQVQSIPTIRCDRLGGYTANYFQDNATDWYCLDWSKQNFTLRSAGSAFLSSMNFIVSNCESETESCHNMPDVEKYLETKKVFLELHLPTYRYSDQDPYIKDNRIILHQLYPGNSFEDSFFVNNVNLTDDQGWIFDEQKDTNFLSLTRTETKSKYIPDHLSYREFPFYIAQLYLEDNVFNYSRSFLKVQDLFASVTGIANFLLLFCQIVLGHYSIFKRQEYLINQVFEYVPKKSLENK
jgi:hypothetical protein